MRLSTILVENKNIESLFPRMSREMKATGEEDTTPVALPELSNEEMLLLSLSQDEDETQRIVDEILAPAY